MFINKRVIKKNCSYIIFFGLVFLSYLDCISQNFKKPNVKDSICKNSFVIDINSDRNNFNFLNEILGNKKIVILAEAKHGDGTSQWIIAKMMKFLIDSLNFKVVVLENGNVDVNYFQSRLLHSENIRQGNIYLSSYFLDRKPGFDLLPFFQTRIKEKKINFFGMDFQVRVDSAIDSLLGETCTFFSCNENLIDNPFTSLLRKLPNFGYKAYLDSSSVEMLITKIDIIIDSLSNAKQTRLKQSENLIRQWMNMKYFITWLNRRFNFTNDTNDPKVTTTYYAARDSAMAENLVWMISNLYPNEKIIVNVSAYHASRSGEKVDGFTECCKAQNVKTFGELLAQTKLKDDIYSIAFISSKGHTGVTNKEISKLPSLKKNSLEYFFSKCKFNSAFFDFRLNKRKYEWLNEKFFMAPFFGRYLKGNWAEVFDGIVYINEMKPNIYFR
jgi:erythromycin esterase